MKLSAILVLVVVIYTSVASGAPRSLLQSAAPPNSRFGGPVVQLSPEVSAPAGTTTALNWHAVGTNNYSSSATSQYESAGSVADLFLENGTKVGKHFFITNSDGSISPAFTRISPTGQLLGTVVGVITATQNAPASNDDGGYGSIPEALLKVTFADGFYANITYIQRVNTLGGVVPGNPKLFTLPATNRGVGNFLLAVPYQADYLFLAPESTLPPTTKSGRH